MQSGKRSMNERLQKIFSNVPVDDESYAKIIARPFPRHRFVVYFTPRSGSSWLTDVVGRSAAMGHCNEIFNPNFMPQIAKTCQAAMIDEYVPAIQRRFNKKGAFSFEITYHQLQAVFPDNTLFLDNFGDCPSFWLIREDIVEQAVSLAKMVTTKVAHAPNNSSAERAASDQAFEYDPVLIKQWLNHILFAERGNEAFFDRNNIKPIRMSYEKMFSRSVTDIVQDICKHVGIPNQQVQDLTTRYTKIGTSKNKLFADYFRRDETAFLNEVAEERSQWLAQLGAMP